MKGSRSKYVDFGMQCSFPRLSLYGEIVWGSVGRDIESPTIIDRRLLERGTVIGIVIEGQAKAYVEARLAELGVANDLVGGESIVTRRSSLSSDPFLQSQDGEPCLDVRPQRRTGLG